MAIGKINSRTKGCKAERKAAKLFADWTGKDFARTPSSGGLQWKSSNSKGDIVSTTEGHYFPFCIEVKNYKEINFEHLMYSKNPKILEFWKQCCDDAIRANKTPILLMRYNGLPSNFFFVVVSTIFYYSVLNQNDYELKPRMVFQALKPEHSIVITTSPEFFKLPYKPIKLILKSLRKNGK